MDLLTRAIILIAIIAGLSIVLYLEVRYMRRKRDSRIDSKIIRDDAYNSIITTRAVSKSLRNRGCDTKDADLILEQAELAFEAGSYSRTKELAGRARSMLQESRRRKEEDPFEGILSSDMEERQPPKVLKEEEEKLPANYVESKFMITNAQRSVDQAAEGGRGATEGGMLLDQAKASFERKDYTEALRLACAAKRRAEGVFEEDLSREEDERVEEDEGGKLTRTCNECGAPLGEDDLYCGSCGRKLDIQPKCPECGAMTKRDDRFCRSCGSRLDGL